MAKKNPGPKKGSLPRTKTVAKPSSASAAPPVKVIRKKTAASTENEVKAVDKELVRLLNRRMELTLAQLEDLKDRH